MLSRLHPSQLMGKWIIPNQRVEVASEEMRCHVQEAEQMANRFQGEKLPVVSSDGHALEALHYPGMDPHTGDKVDRAAKTVILFAGQGAYHHWLSGYVEKYTQRGLNVVSFNYPGIGQSEGEATRQKIVRGCEAVIDQLERQFSIPRECMALHGHSLGGGFAAQAAARRPGINIINDRSFSKLSLASHNFIRGVLPTHGAFRSIVAITRAVENIAYLAFRSTGWELDSEEAWPTISGKKCVVYHSKDPVISQEASLFRAIYGRDQEATFIVLDDDCIDPHSRLLSDQEIDQIVQAIGFDIPQVADVPPLGEMAPTSINQGRCLRWLREEASLFSFLQRITRYFLSTAAAFFPFIFRRSVT